MTERPPEAVKLPRRFRASHPISFVVCSAIGVFLAGVCAAFYVAVRTLMDLTELPSTKPSVGLLIGLAAGFAIVAEETWLLRRYGELEAHAIAFGGDWKYRLLRVLPIAGSFVLLPFAVLYLLFGREGIILLPWTFAGLYVPLVFLYRPTARVRARARQMYLESIGSTRAAAAPEPPSRLARWVTPLGVMSVLIVLGVAGGLKCGVAFFAQREPRHFETKADDTYGVATRLTYGNDACAPAISPDGRLVAYVKDVWMWRKRLEIMRPDGKGKRRLAEAAGLSPAGFLPLRWSPDGKQILVIGDRVPAPKTWDDAFKEGESFAYDLWIADVASGDARRLTDDDAYLAGMWLPAVHKIAAIRSTRHKWARLWLMDERGGNRFTVANLKLRRNSLAAQPWHDGRDVVAVGTDDTAGIWSVDATTGRVTRLSDIEAGWALPIAPRWLVIGVKGRAYPPFHRASSIGLFDTVTGKVHWALQDLQGMVERPGVVPKLGVVVFTLRLDEGHDLWALRISDGQLRRLTRGESAGSAAVDPAGKTIFYQATNTDDESRGWLNVGDSIWRLVPGRPLASARWEVRP
jgi:Tol biopolymer transport system component